VSLRGALDLLVDERLVASRHRELPDFREAVPGGLPVAGDANVHGAGLVEVMAQ
jgi:hypothetical protein